MDRHIVHTNKLCMISYIILATSIVTDAAGVLLLCILIVV